MPTPYFKMSLLRQSLGIPNLITFRTSDIGDNKNRKRNYEKNRVNYLSSCHNSTVNVSFFVTLSSRRKLSRICALFKAYSGERAWKAIGDKLQRPHYLSRINHERKIRIRTQRTDMGKYYFVNRNIQDWNQLPAEVLGTLSCKLRP